MFKLKSKTLNIIILIYHNPRCSKSRQALNLLEKSGKEFQIIKYLENPLTKDQLTEIITLLNIKPIDLVRKNELIWKENYKGKQLSDSEIIEAMIQNPKLIERPIVINNDKAEFEEQLQIYKDSRFQPIDPDIVDQENIFEDIEKFITIENNKNVFKRNKKYIKN